MPRLYNAVAIKPHAEDVHKQHDETRTAYLAQRHIYVLRFWNNEVLNNLEGVWEKIKETMERS